MCPEPEQNKKNQQNPIRPPALPQKRDDGVDKQDDERRIAKRVEVSTEVSLESETNFYVGFTSDISAGGLFVVTWDTAEIGTQITLNFKLPNSSRVVKIEGIVRWVREHNPTDPDLWPGMGIQFDNLTSEAKSAIDSFLKHRDPLFYD